MEQERGKLRSALRSARGSLPPPHSRASSGSRAGTAPARSRRPVARSLAPPCPQRCPWKAGGRAPVPAVPRYLRGRCARQPRPATRKEQRAELPPAEAGREGQGRKGRTPGAKEAPGPATPAGLQPGTRVALGHCELRLATVSASGGNLPPGTSSRNWAYWDQDKSASRGVVGGTAKGPAVLDSKSHTRNGDRVWPCSAWSEPHGTSRSSKGNPTLSHGHSGAQHPVTP